MSSCPIALLMSRRLFIITRQLVARRSIRFRCVLDLYRKTRKRRDTTRLSRERAAINHSAIITLITLAIEHYYVTLINSKEIVI